MQSIKHVCQHELSQLLHELIWHSTCLGGLGTHRVPVPFNVLC